MLDVARINVEIANVTERILLVHADSKRLPFETDRFALVISNSLLHHIPDPLVAMREMVRVAAHDGSLFVRDLLRPTSVADVEQIVGLYASDESAEAQRLFRESLHAALNLSEIRGLVEQLGFAAGTVQPTSDRHWTWCARMSEQRTRPDE
jgi:ubiquinone/menaquinone biosynthesis C-methylase UbiE